MHAVMGDLLPAASKRKVEEEKMGQAGEGEEVVEGMGDA